MTATKLLNDAAPDMLEALEEVFESLKRWDAFGSIYADKLIQKVDLIIKKAKGL